MDINYLLSDGNPSPEIVIGAQWLSLLLLTQVDS